MIYTIKRYLEEDEDLSSNEEESIDVRKNKLKEDIRVPLDPKNIKTTYYYGK